MLPEPSITILGVDSPHRIKFINGNAYQQDAILTFKGYQYATFYASLSSEAKESLFVHLARRQLPSLTWEIMVFDDYAQTTDDPHNTVQLGICPGDGTIHLSYDHHCDRLRYRHSVANLAKTPGEFEWKTQYFSPNLDHLIGLPSDHKWFREVTYPRFGILGEDMFFSFRSGRAGYGSDHLYLYSASTGRYTFLGTHLTGIKNNPYVNGIDYRNGRMHITFTYRGWVFYEGWDDPLNTKHKQHSGPNGPENNYNICYVYSDDKGVSWKNGAGEVVADLGQEKQNSIVPDSPGITAFHIPKNTGLSNQEAQAVDHDEGVHILNRDRADGTQSWKHYYRDFIGTWTARPIPGVDGRFGGLRGRLAVSKMNDLYLILPGNDSEGTLKILKATQKNGYRDYNLVWQKVGFPCEPLIDPNRLEENNVLSVFAVLREDQSSTRNVVVLDFPL